MVEEKIGAGMVLFHAVPAKAEKHILWEAENMSDKRKLSESGRTKFITLSGKIYEGSCIVDCVNVAGDGAAADCQIYDGENANAEQKAHIEALSGTTADWCPSEGSRFDYGIYVAVNAATTKVSVTFFPVIDV
ncbi:MAG: hypothetical protein KAV87_63080 [Desulfobacteraceae bacterium]|nr:hypothetical protein [Desulfobacteraceae bacterium]